MNPRFQVLDAGTHAGLRFSAAGDYRFAAQQRLVPVVVGEIDDVAREYPIVFPKDLPGPHALMGVAGTPNVHVDVAGRWLGAYVPAALRFYPFTLSRPEAAADGKAASASLLVDTQAPHFNADTGEPLFDEQRQPTRLLGARINALKAYRQQLQITAALTRLITDSGLLADADLVVKHADGSGFRLAGARAVDEKNLHALDDKAWLALRKAMPLIHAHLLSLANLRQGKLLTGEAVAKAA